MYYINSVYYYKFYVLYKFYACLRSFLCYFFNHFSCTFLKKCVVAYNDVFCFILVSSAVYLFNLFTSPFLAYIEGSQYYWHGDHFMVPHFSISISRSLYLLIIFIGIYVIIPWH